MIEDHSHKFSPSKLSTYQQCPRKYKFRYIDRLKSAGQTVEQFLGTCVHKAFEDLHSGLQNGKRLTEDETTAVFEGEWDKGEFKDEAWKNVGRDCVRNYYRQWQPFDRDRTVAVERKIGFPLIVDGKEYLLEGFMDRLALSVEDGAFEIHDYKTAKTLPPQEHVDEDWQLALYEIAVRHNWPDTKGVRLRWHYVRHGKTLTSTRTAGQLEALRKEAEGLVGRIKTDHEFAPKESRLCDWCEFKALCPLFSHGEALKLLPPEIASADEGRAAVDALEAIDERKRALRAQVKTLEAEEGALEERLKAFAAKRGFESVAGTHVDAHLSKKDSYKFPTKTHAPDKLEEMEAELKGTPLWNLVSHVDTHKLLDGLKGKAWPKDVRALAEGVVGRYAQRVAESVLRLRRRKDD